MKLSTYFSFMSWLRTLLIASLIAFLSSNCDSACAAKFRTVALTGQQAPGMPISVSISSVALPSLNDAGQTAFRAGFYDSQSGLTYGSIWSEGSGELTMVTRTNNQVPSGEQSFVSFYDPSLNSAGQTAFLATLLGNTDSIWSEGIANLELVARNGMQAVGMPVGQTYDIHTNRSLLLNDAGQIAFAGGCFGLCSQGVWSGTAEGLKLVAGSGFAAPDTPNGVTFGIQRFAARFPAFSDPVLNDSGQTAFFAFIRGDGVDDSNDQGIWAERQDALSLVARTGNPASGTPDSVDFARFDQPAINNAGQIAFSANLTGSDVNTVNNHGIWSDRGGNLGLVARAGSPIPGASGLNYRDLSLGQPLMNNPGQIAFVSGFTGNGITEANNVGIVVEDFGDVVIVAQEGDHAPGTPDSVSFTDLYDSEVILNDAGQIAFDADLTGDTVSGDNRSGMWATDRNGSLHLILRQGDLLEVAPGDFRTVSDFSFEGGTGNSDGRLSAFNNRGQLAFAARFTDETGGVFVSNIVAIPEPSLFGILFFTGAMLFIWRRFWYLRR